MIDLHMHTVYSDGDKTVNEILKMCEENKLECISITDHNTCKQYTDDSYINNKNFKGKIIKGVEIYAVVDNKTIEILGYDYDIDSMTNFLDKYFSKERMSEQKNIVYEKLLKICDKLNLKYDVEKIKIPEIGTDVERPIYKELINYNENTTKMGELAESFKIFYRKGLTNPKSDFYIKYSNFSPKYKDVVIAIHNAGGIAFLAHPYEYKFNNTIEFIEKIRKVEELDGIECYHPSANEDQIRELNDYCQKNNLLQSGGSDYHGNKKIDIKIGVGKGNLNIPYSIVSQWYKK